MRKDTAKGFIITCAGIALQLGHDRRLYVLVHDPVSIFSSRKDARNAIRRTIHQRIRAGFNDKFAKAQCFQIHTMVRL